MTLRWLGTAPKTPQVQNYTFAGTIEADDLVRITIGTVSVDVTTGSTTAATVAENVKTAFNALSATSYPAFAEITATRSGDDLILTAETAGVPFVVTLTPLEANGSAADAQTIEGSGTATTGSTTTANSGPNDWSVAANWSTGAVPVDSDDVVLENSNVDILYGLSQTSIDLASLTIKQSFTGKLGLPKRNAGGYEEYRTDYLTLNSCVLLTVGEGPGSGSGRLKIHVGTNAACTANVYNTGSPAENGLHALILKGSPANSVLNANKGTIDVCPFAGETATITTMRLGYRDNPASDVTVRCGSGVTLTTITKNGGQLETNSAIGTSITNTAGEAVLRGSGNIAQLTVLGGTVRMNNTGTLGGNTVVAEDGWLDFGQDQQAKTVTNPIEIYGKRARCTDPFKVVATYVLDFNQTPVEVNGSLIGTNVRITRGTPA